MLVDTRCPACNKPLFGKDEVTSAKTPPVSDITCRNCETPAARTPGAADDITAYHYSKV